MREIHLLENKDACHKFIKHRRGLGYSLDSFLGIGTFSSQLKNRSTTKGIQIRSTPAFLQNELSESVILGHFSVFEQDSLLLQVSNNEIIEVPISRWFLVGQHLSLFSSPKIDVLRYLPIKELTGVRNSEEFIQVYLGYLFPNIQEIRAQTILFLLDIKLLTEYIRDFFMWLSDKFEVKSTKEYITSIGEVDLRRKVAEEFLWFLSDSALHPCLALFPSSQECYEDLVDFARIMRQQGNLSDDLVFKL